MANKGKFVNSSILSKIVQAVVKTKVFLATLTSKIPYFRTPAPANIFRSHGHSQIELDKKLVYSLSKTRIPNLRQLKYLNKYLSKTERWLLRACIFIIIASITVSGTFFYLNHLETIPVKGGKYTEAMIGSPKYLNPLYSSLNDIDHDLSRLVYSSLFTRNSGGELTPDIVEEYSVSDDHKVYSLTIKPDLRWHDGSSLTVDDVIFTFVAIQDKTYKSPLRISFTGVEIAKTGERSFQFTLAEPYAAFLELLTFGIMPSEFWRQIPAESASLAELNLKPIGSGPFKFDSLVKDKTGNIREYYLRRNEDFYLQRPYIETLGFKFYAGFEEAVAALNEKNVDGLSFLPQELASEVVTPRAMNFHKLHLPQINALFFNPERNAALKDKAVRQALYGAIDRAGIASGALEGDAYVVDGPILPQSFAYKSDVKKYAFDEAAAAALLEGAGWLLKEITADDIASSVLEETATGTAPEQTETLSRIGEGNWRQKDKKFLVINLTTVDRLENDRIVNAIKAGWEKIGVKTEITLIPVSQAQSAVIKPRNYDALFYGLILGSDPDPYAFWHSTQIGENGLNLANFSNKEVDKLLEEARLQFGEDERREKYSRFQEIIAEEAPAIFLYSPVYTYLQTKDVKGFNVNNLFFPSDRFANVYDWYVKTGKKLIWN